MNRTAGLAWRCDQRSEACGFRVQHITTYKYSRLLALGLHGLRLRPRGELQNRRADTHDFLPEARGVGRARAHRATAGAHRGCDLARLSQGQAQRHGNGAYGASRGFGSHPLNQPLHRDVTSKGTQGLAAADQPVARAAAAHAEGAAPADGNFFGNARCQMPTRSSIDVDA